MSRFAASLIDRLALFAMTLIKDRRPLPGALPPAGSPADLAGVAAAAHAGVRPLGESLGEARPSGLASRAEDYVLRPPHDGDPSDRSRVRRAWPARTVRRRVAFPSPLPGPHEANNTVRGLYYAPRADGPPPPSAVVLHGYRQGVYGPARLFARWCAEAGWGGMALALPYHISRRVKGTRNGELMVTADLGRLLAAIRQAVADALAAAEMLRRAGAPRVAMVGGSIGGWVAALAAACEAELDAVILIVPVTEPALLLERLPILRAQRRALAEAGVTRGEMERALGPVTPRNLGPAVARGRMLFLYGDYDLVNPPVTVDRLWRAWGRPARRVYPYGHFSLVALERALFPEIGRFLELRGWPARTG
ncbi:MAG: alpha/beta hydrolase family protein [Planctomycetota bacterium]